MGRAMLAFTIMAAATVAEAATFQWTDDRGVIGFTDDLNNVPARYRNKVRTREDITTRNPRIRQELREREERLPRRENAAPGGALAPDDLPRPTLRPESGVRREVPDDSTPPGRTKSQRIRDNIEQRRLREQ